jgi:hypothetical protein
VDKNDRKAKMGEKDRKREKDESDGREREQEREGYERDARDRQADGRTDLQTERQTDDKQTDRQTETETEIFMRDIRDFHLTIIFLTVGAMALYLPPHDFDSAVRAIGITHFPEFFLMNNGVFMFLPQLLPTLAFFFFSPCASSCCRQVLLARLRGDRATRLCRLHHKLSGLRFSICKTTACLQRGCSSVTFAHN